MKISAHATEWLILQPEASGKLSKMFVGSRKGRKEVTQEGQLGQVVSHRERKSATGNPGSTQLWGLGVEAGDRTRSV